MFGLDILTQTETTIFTFGTVVAQIHDLDGVEALAAELAQRHVAYGVEARHYPLVGRAVLSILGEVLGSEHFTAYGDDAGSGARPAA